MTGLRDTEPIKKGGSATISREAFNQSYSQTKERLTVLFKTLEIIFSNFREIKGLKILRPGESVINLEARLSHATSVTMDSHTDAEASEDDLYYSFLDLTRELIIDAIKIYQYILCVSENNWEIPLSHNETTTLSSDSIPNDYESVIAIAQAFLEIPVRDLETQYGPVILYAQYFNDVNQETLSRMQETEAKTNDALNNFIPAIKSALAIALEHLETGQ